MWRSKIIRFIIVTNESQKIATFLIELICYTAFSTSYVYTSVLHMYILKYSIYINTPRTSNSNPQKQLYFSLPWVLLPSVLSMDYFLLCLLTFLLVVSGHESGADDVPFEENYSIIYGEDRIKLLNHHKKIKISVDQYSGWSSISIL